MNYWIDTPEPMLDPPEDKVFCCCDYCGGEIYEGEEFYEIGCDRIHEDCLLEYAKDKFAVKREANRYAYC